MEQNPNSADLTMEREFEQQQKTSATETTFETGRDQTHHATQIQGRAKRPRIQKPVYSMKLV